MSISSRISCAALAAALCAVAEAGPIDCPTDLPRIEPVAYTVSYPAPASKAGVEGRVVLAVTIGNGGGVTATKAIDEFPDDWTFGTHAEISALSWRFPDTPPGRYCVIVEFRLETPHDGISFRESGSPGLVPLARVRPIYPAPALHAQHAGTVEIVAEVDDDGEVQDWHITNETPAGFGFGYAVIESIRRWRFQPSDGGNYNVVVTFAPPHPS